MTRRRKGGGGMDSFFQLGGHLEESVEELFDIDNEPTITEPPVLEEEADSNDSKDPVLKEGDSCDQGQTTSDEKELDESTVSQRNVSDVVGEQDLGGNLSQPPNDPEANLAISDRKMPTDKKPTSVAKQPRKRKQKPKNICVPPAVKGRKKRGPSKKKPRAAKVEKPEAGFILPLDSSDKDNEPDEDSGPVATTTEAQKRPIGLETIDWESDGEYLRKEKKSRLFEISSDEESVEELFDTDDELTIIEPLIIEEDADSNDLKDPVLKEGDSCDQGQTTSDEKELDESTVSQRNVSDDVGEQDLGGNLSQPPNDPEANLAISDRKMPTDKKPTSVAKQPRKRKQKPKNICVPPAVKGRKKRGPSKKKPRAAKVEKPEAGFILPLDSSDKDNEPDEDSGPVATTTEAQKRPIGLETIDWESDGEYLRKEKKSRLFEISSDGKYTALPEKQLSSETSSHTVV
ncbi:germ cell nuclear acidic protein-like [Eulemur rufifrons]|uniref:germ cell nuclear acidic protein-like n=1 Tax=Eulemur rufifrons TaxID=859984 RepID=UPI0037421F68